MFSVVIPLYNKELSVVGTVNSVLSQTFKEFEIVIVNDGSTDNSLENVKQIKNERIRIINKPNQGVSSARNRGIKEARYEWIAFLDADDLWESNHLEVLNHLIIKYPTYKVFCTSYIKSFQETLRQQEKGEIVIEDYFTHAPTSFFCSSVACIHKYVFDQVGDFSTMLNRGEDLDLWVRIGREYSFIRSKVVTAIYRIEAENRSDQIVYDINKSFLSIIDIKKTCRSSEKIYFRRLLYNAFRRFLKQGDFKNAIFVFRKLI